MNVIQKVRAVERIYSNLDKEIAQFRSSTGLGCLPGCGECCKKPDIEATMVEFLPLAFHLFKTGRAEETLDLIERELDRKICVIFSPVAAGSSAGFCSEYAHRGMICRLFGYAAVRNKYGEPELATCRKIKSELPELFLRANEDIKKGLSIPVISQYYYRLYPVDMQMAGKMFPINEAIRIAIETVAMYFFYNAPKAS